MTNKKETKKTCENCKFWKNKQQLTNYHNEIGFCINPKFNFNTIDGRIIGVIDKENLRDRTKITGNPSHDFETLEHFNVKPSRYCLTVTSDFGCIYHQK